MNIDFKDLYGPLKVHWNRPPLYLIMTSLQIDIPEIGEIYKIRISTSEDSTWNPDWLLDKVVMEHIPTKQILTFPCNR